MFVRYGLAIIFGVLLGVGASCVKKGADVTPADASTEAVAAVDGGVVELAPAVAPPPPALVAPAAPAVESVPAAK